MQIKLRQTEPLQVKCRIETNNKRSKRTCDWLSQCASCVKKNVCHERKFVQIRIGISENKIKTCSRRSLLIANPSSKPPSKHSQIFINQNNSFFSTKIPFYLNYYSLSHMQHTFQLHHSNKYQSSFKLFIILVWPRVLLNPGNAIASS